MFGRFFGPEREIRRINKGALEVIDYARQCFKADTVKAIAQVTGEHLDRAHKVFESTPVGAKRAIVEYQRLHKEARNQRDDVTLTAFTLVILYIRAELQGDPCHPARDAIDAFLAEWAHALE